MTENVAAAVKGALVGWTLGSQTRGRKELRPLSFYEPIPPRMSSSEAIEAWLVWSRHLAVRGAPQFLGPTLAASWRYVTDESAFGLGNVDRGLTSPISGSFANPLCEGSNAIGRAVYWGIAFHGRPDEAARWAYFDAAIDHAKDGVWIPVAIARAISVLSPDRSVIDIVRDLGNSAPRKSALHRAMGPILKSVGNPDGLREAYDQLPGLLGVSDRNHSALSASWLMLGLLHGGLDFERSVLATASCGGAASHATLACGAICGFVRGDVPLAWTKPLGDAMVYGHGLRGIDGPSSVEGLAALVTQDFQSHSAAPVALPVAEGEEPLPAVMPSSAMTETLKSLLDREPVESFCDVGAVRVAAQYIDPPSPDPGVATKLALKFENIGAESVTLHPEVIAPSGFELAHKVTECVLPAGASASFAAVYKVPTSFVRTGAITVRLPDGDASLPVFPQPLWYVVGPMTNQEGTGFDKEYPAEKNIKLGQVFNGRSNLPVEWTPLRPSGTSFDVEKVFGAGPGTLYLFANVRMPRPGKYRIVVASGVGAIVWIDEKKLFWYHDTHNPVPRAVEPYVGSFSTEGAFKVLIKTFRNLEPVPPLTVYFLAEDGSLAVPEGFDPIA